MIAQGKALDIEAIAKEVIVSLSSHSQIPTFSSRPGGLTLTQAYRVTPLLRAAFEARGERITGRKIGFTNRQMWKAFGVESPIWGYTTSHTTRDLADPVIVSVNEFSEPRIEPEIMFGLRTPAGRFANPDEYAGTAVYLESRASDFVTGATICVDGGYSIR